MEGKEGLNLTIKGGYEAPQSFRVEPRVENSGGRPPPPVTAATPGVDGRKKRGRPRKYAGGGGGGSVAALSPMPISASIPLTGEFSTWQQPASRPVESTKKKHKLDFETRGKKMASSAGAGSAFTPHVMTVNKGEDVTMKIISFSQQGSRAICILAANGTVSNVTLRQPDSSGGTLTYEGRFEILSLTGSFMPSDNGLTKSRSGGMSVSLAGPDGRVLGGGLAGMLIAAGPIQVVIGSFLTGEQQQREQQPPKPKKPKYEHTIAFAPVPSIPTPIPEERYETVYNAPKPNLTNSTSFHGDNSTSMNHPMHGGFKITVSETNHPMPGEDSRDRSHEITC